MVGTILAARRLTVSFHGVQALAGPDIDVSQGEILGLIGPNGAGKTTAIDVLSGFRQPDEGTVSLQGRDVTRHPVHERARRGLVRSFQGARAFRRLTVLENVEAGAVARGLSRRVARETAQRLIRRFELDGLAGRLAGELPFGTGRRLELARALAGQPSLLLLDEPAAGLNEEESRQLASLILGIREEDDCSVVVVEHDMDLIMGICDRVHVLASGSTIAVGKPSEVRADAQVIEAYLGGDEPAH